MTDLATRFSTLYRGHEKAFGQYHIQEPENKIETLRRAVTPADWARHLKGGDVAGMGAAPLRADGKLWFGAIDLDDDEVDHAALVQKVEDLGLPLVVCRSKSGGAHLYLFIKGDEPAPAVLGVEKLRQWVEALGLKNPKGKDGEPRPIEIFPKHTTLRKATKTKKAQVGNWINLPYFGNGTTERPAFGTDGEALTLARFLAFAERQAITPEQLVLCEPRKAGQVLQALLPFWADEGARHFLGLFAPGAMRKGGVSEEDVRWVVDECIDRTESEHESDRTTAMLDTFEAFDDDPDSVAGVSKIREYVGDDLAATLSAILGRVSEEEDEGEPFPMPTRLSDITEPPEPPNWLIGNFLPENEPVMIYSDSGVGKTTLALSIACCVAGGHPLFDHRFFPVLRRGPVLLVSEEDGAATIYNRLHALIKGHGYVEKRIAENLHFHALQGVLLDDPKTQKAILQQVEALGIVLVIFDPYAEMIKGAENSNDDARPVVKYFRQLTEAGATSLLLHHSGKPSEGRKAKDRYRGASALMSGMRAAFSLDEIRGGVRVECTKMNRTEKLKPFVVNREIVSDEDNRAAWISATFTHKEEKDAGREWLLTLIEDRPGISSSDIRKATGTDDGAPSRGIAERLIQSLQDDKVIFYEMGPHGSHLHHLTEATIATRKRWKTSPDNPENSTLSTLSQGEELEDFDDDSPDF